MWRQAPLSKAYEVFPKLIDNVWKSELNSHDEIYLSIFLKENNTLVVSASFQKFALDTIEFGFDVVERYRNQGIATELVKGMLRVMRTVFHGRGTIIKTDKMNGACRKVAEKCGGIFTGYEPTFAARAFASLIESFGNESTGKEKWIQIRKRYYEYIEENKDVVCVYYFK